MLSWLQHEACSVLTAESCTSSVYWTLQTPAIIKIEQWFDGSLSEATKLHPDHPSLACSAMRSVLSSSSQPQGDAHLLTMAMKASCGTFTLPMDFMRFLPSACFFSNFFFLQMSHSAGMVAHLQLGAGSKPLLTVGGSMQAAGCRNNCTC